MKLYKIDDLGKDKKKLYKSNYKRIYSVIKKYQGEDLYHQLTKYLDVEMYMQWLAFNYIVRNGDYTDELYFYIDAEDDRFKIIPWDYDDILSTFPHEGLEQRNAILDSKLLFSSEELLDQIIATDDYLYSLYLAQLDIVIEQLKPEMLKNELETIYQELYPFYANNEIIAQSVHNQYPKANLETLEMDMRKIFQQLVILRSQLQKK